MLLLKKKEEQKSITSSETVPVSHNFHSTQGGVNVRGTAEDVNLEHQPNSLSSIKTIYTIYNKHKRQQHTSVTISVV